MLTCAAPIITNKNKIPKSYPRRVILPRNPRNQTVAFQPIAAATEPRILTAKIDVCGNCKARQELRKFSLAAFGTHYNITIPIVLDGVDVLASMHKIFHIIGVGFII